ncbi:MAG: sulfatase [Armatimonadetes bacterium]|nr:sulfatase [Armatimonadota bacterium]
MSDVLNAVIIISDTLRRDFLGCYGNDWVRTPNIDALAAESIVLDNCFTGSFPTIPHRADLMTGRYNFPFRPWAPLPPDERPIQVAARAAGIITALITDHTQLLAPGYNFHQGFMAVEWIRGQAPDAWRSHKPKLKPPCDPAKLREPGNWLQRYLANIEGRRTEADWFSPQTFTRAMEWLELNYDHDRFLLFIDLFDVHEPWTPPRWYVDMYDPGYDGEEVIYPRYDAAGYLTEAELTHVRALYAATITMMDRWLGMFLDKLQAVGRWDDTAILFTADHGWYHGEHGLIGKHTVLEPKLDWPFYDEVARIPAILKIPGEPPRREGVLCQPVDLMATLCDLLNIQPPQPPHGRSILPALRGQGPIRQLAVTSRALPADPGWRVYSAITDGRWSLQYPGPAWPAELYDRHADPQMERNIIGDYSGEARRLHQAYLDFLAELGTPEEKLRLRELLSF